MSGGGGGEEGIAKYLISLTGEGGWFWIVLTQEKNRYTFWIVLRTKHIN